MKKYIIFFLLINKAVLPAKAQDAGLLNGIESTIPAKEYVTNAFKSSRVINGHSMEMIGKGVLDFRILHRFGDISQGATQLFGLDQASMRIGFDYGIAKNSSIGFGRSTLNKELDAFVKHRLLWQTINGIPFSVVLVGGITVNTVKNVSTTNKITFNDRSTYYYQAIIGRKFNRKFTLQVTPTVVHRNRVAANDENDIYAIGAGARFKLTKRVAFVIDYFYSLNGLPKSDQQNPLSIGFDFETGGHVFQLHFSNTNGMNERAFITETNDNWGKGEIHFGFNLSRVFTVKRSNRKN